MDKPTQINLEMLGYVANQVFGELEEKEKSGGQISRHSDFQEDNQQIDEQLYRQQL